MGVRWCGERGRENGAMDCRSPAGRVRENRESWRARARGATAACGSGRGARRRLRAFASPNTHATVRGAMARHVALFATCLGDQLWPEVVHATAAVLQRAGCTVTFDPAQTCCGQ